MLCAIAARSVHFGRLKFTPKLLNLLKQVHHAVRALKLIPYYMSFGVRVSMTWLKPPRSGIWLNRVTRLWGDCLKNWADQALERWFVCHTVRSNNAASAPLGSLLPMSTRAQPAKSKKLTVRLTCTWTCIRVRMCPEDDKPISRSLRLARLPFLLLKSEMDCACGKVLRRKDCDSASDKTTANDTAHRCPKHIPLDVRITSDIRIQPRNSRFKYAMFRLRAKVNV